MFRNILVPTDGSKLAAKGVRAGVKLAQSLGAKVTGVYVVPREPIEAYRRDRLQAAKKALAIVEIEAHTAGVPCQTRIVTAPKPHAGILRAARAAKCDAIAMASHGRGAVGGLLLGSETSRVLSHSRLPVLVAR
jgi:nucleotide-binding universal stress UspA family protein